MPESARDSSWSSYRIFETEQFRRDLGQISGVGGSKVAERLRKRIYPELHEHPHFGPIKKLKGWRLETWRYRIGSWRFFYEIDERAKIVFMIAAAHRSSAY